MVSFVLLNKVSAEQENPYSTSLNKNGNPGCMVPKAAGTLKNTSVVYMGGATGVFAMFEDSKGTIRYYQYWEPAVNGFGQAMGKPTCVFSYVFDRK